MKKLFLGAMVVCIIMSAGIVMAQEHGTMAECVALVKQAIEIASKQGEDAAFKEIMKIFPSLLIKNISWTFM